MIRKTPHEAKPVTTRKLRWVIKKDGWETIAEADLYDFTLNAGRVRLSNWYDSPAQNWEAEALLIGDLSRY